MVDYKSRRRRRKKESSKIFLYSNLAKYSLIAFVGFLLVIVGVFLWYGKDLPTPGKLVTAPLSQSTHIYDRNGVLLYSVYQNEDRSYVSISDIPKTLQHATIAIEDKNFYQNQGFSLTGYLRAIFNLIRYRSISGGGSTLTQQLVKNVLLTPQQNFSRKIKELMLAIQVDQKYSKNQILEMYLNDVPYGGATVGVEAASETYFGKPVKDLDLAQSAFLAGLPQSPSAYSPFSGQKYYLARSQEVLNAMSDQGYITQKQAKDAMDEVTNMQFSQSQGQSIKAPYFVMYVKQLLAKQFGEQVVASGGLQVTTTLDYSIEQKAEGIVKTEINGLKTYDVGNGAAVVMDPKTGQILSMVGGKDYFGDPTPSGCQSGSGPDSCVFDPNFNVAISKRQPGSSLKPIMYATAFEHGYTPASLIMDAPTDFKATASAPDYQPVNYSGKFLGPVQIRYALSNSLNIPAVKMLARLGTKTVMQQAYNMGIENWQPTDQNMADVGLSLVLGGRETTLLNETTAYSVFATEGVKHDPVAILKVTDSKGNVLYENKPTDGQQVLSKEASYLISSILSDNQARSLDFGLHSWLYLPAHPSVAVKTGTTDNKRDNWTVGYSPDYVVGVWVGNDNNATMNQAISSGITGASPIWNKIMTAILSGKPDKPFDKPDDIISMQIDALGGGLPKDGQPTRQEYFMKGTQPTTQSPIYQTVNGQTYIEFKEDDPVSTDGVNRWQQGIDAWVNSAYPNNPLYHPPAATASATPTPGH